MAGLARAELPLVGEWGRECGRLTITALPSQRSECTIYFTDDADDEFERVRLVEGKEYVYVVGIAEHSGPFETDHPEMFIADSEQGDRGRLRTGLNTGAVEVQFFAGSKFAGKACFEVQSTKLSYHSDYQWMLRDIAGICTELVMERFAPAAARFSVDDARNAETLYQRFTFLRSVLEGDEFQASMRHILTSPYVSWDDVEEVRWHARGLCASSRVARSLTRPGPRSITPHPFVGELDSVPQQLVVSRSATSVDNVPNRFVKWLLQEWLALGHRVSEALVRHDERSAFTRRGRREVRAAMTLLAAILEDDFFQNVGELRRFPEANQVLQKREGYRFLFRTHLQLEAAARLSWPGLDPVYRSGQRNVAKLYEYWVYLQLGRIVARLCGQSFDARRLMESHPDGLTLRLHSREETMVKGTVERFGQRIHLESWFNKSFGATTSGHDGSWTRPLRPDCSLRIEVATNGRSSQITWIHFDAKYRIERLEKTFLGDDDRDEDVDRSRFRREDLLKMHAYKDAIRQSAGAYIVYPGTEEVVPFRQYHELLPGLGAFPLRPSRTGESHGSDTLTDFVEHVLTHLALQATQYARAHYWTERAHQGPSVIQVLPATPFLSQPPADVPVLLGYAKNADHRAWIKRTSLYNLRADPGRGGAIGADGLELGARVLIVFGSDQTDVDIYEIVDAPRILAAKQLHAMHYPRPRGNHYLCFALQSLPSEHTSSWLTNTLVARVRAQKKPHLLEGAPMLVTWLDLCAAVISSPH